MISGQLRPKNRISYFVSVFVCLQHSLIKHAII